MSSSDRYPISTLLQYERPPAFMAYGTSGFRARSELLRGVMARVGVLAALRSKKCGKTIGVVITASHNPEHDNGVKIVDPEGGMMEVEWEALAAQLANAPDAEFGSVLNEIIREQNINLDNPAVLFIGRDNRPSSESLSNLVAEGAKVVGARIEDFGVVTTPMIHWAVRKNYFGLPYDMGTFVNELENAFRSSLAGLKITVPTLIVDCANGAGATVLPGLAKRLSDLINIQIVNGGEGKINEDCGADYVQKAKGGARGITPEVARGLGCVSLDGDADRVVYYFYDDADQFHLLDGDKIATLSAHYVSSLCKEMGVSLNVGVVQTAYANGASTAYLKSKNVPTSCVPTGVKHLHPEAEKFDVGVYFEANGHGTILLSEHAREVIKKAVAAAPVEKTTVAARLGALEFLANQAIGDGIADLLFAYAAFTYFGWDLKAWDAMYTDLPSRQSIVRVADRSVIRTADAERVCVAPEGLQAAIDSLVRSIGTNSRAFVRPSGTEDVVRVYAESSSQETTDQLAKEVGRAVHRMAGGVGEYN